MTTGEGEYYKLRTEWLRFKSHLQDRLTGLPSLPAVLEDVRRLVERSAAVDVLYLDLGRSGWHETKLGWAAYDEAIRDFAARLKALRDKGALLADDVVCLHTVRSDRFLVFRPVLDAASGNELHDIGVRKERLLQALRTGEGRSPLPLRFASGHALIGKDPMVRGERAIQQAVSDAMIMSLREREGIDSTRREELLRLISESRVRTVFHPIVRLNDLGVVGHEALTRPVGEHVFDSVEELFSFAESTDLVTEFERLCRTTAIRSAAGIGPARRLLFLNASARAVEDPEWSNGTIEALLRAAGLSPRDVVVEITERLAVVRHDTFSAVLRSFKERGYRVAIDDMGAGYASLHALLQIEPDFLKFDVSLVRDIHKSSIKRSLLESLRALGDKIRARVIAEGIEKQEERETLVSLGVELGQGFLFHKDS